MRTIIIIVLLLLLNSELFCQKLSLTKEIPLIEPDSIIVASIYKIDYDKSGNKFLITDYKANQAIISDPKTGKILKVFDDFQNFSDSLAAKINLNTYNNYADYHFSYKEAVDKYKMYPTYEEAKKWLKPQIKNAVFYENQIILAISTRCFAFKTDHDTIVSSYIDNNYSIITYNAENYKFSKYNFIDQPIKSYKYSFFRPDQLLFISKDTLLGCFEAFTNYKMGNRKETYTTALYIPSKHIYKPLSILPDEYHDAHLGYFMLGTNIDINRNRDILVSYSLSPYITNISKNKKYYLENLINRNKKLMDSLQTVKKINKYGLLDGIYKIIFSFRIQNFSCFDDGYLIIWQEINNERKSIAHISQYNINFILINDYTLPFNNPKGNIYNIFYIKTMKKILVVRKDKDRGYLFQYYEINK